VLPGTLSDCDTDAKGTRTVLIQFLQSPFFSPRDQILSAIHR
jgi:hypothetical protein